MKQLLLTIVIVLALSTVIPTTYALSPIEDAKLMDDILDRLVSIDGTKYTIECPTFSQNDEFTIDMKITEVSREYYENYERILCEDLSPGEIIHELETELSEKIKSNSNNDKHANH